MRRQRFGSRLPAKANHAAEVTVPHPATKTGNAIDDGTVRQLDWISLGLVVDHARNEGRRVRSNAFEFLGSRSGTAHVVRRPATLKRCNISGQMFERRPDEMHDRVRGGSGV